MWPPVQSDDVVRLRPIDEHDREPVFAALTASDEISRWTRIPWPYERAHLDQFFSLQTSWRAGRSDAVFAITAPDESGDALLGCIGAHRIGGVDRARSSFLPDEPGYWLAPAARGRGLATRSLRLVASWLLHDLGRSQVNIQTKVDNAASRRVIEAVGFRYVGTVLGADLDDDDTDHDRFVLTPTDLPLR